MNRPISGGKYIVFLMVFLIVVFVFLSNRWLMEQVNHEKQWLEEVQKVKSIETSVVAYKEDRPMNTVYIDPNNDPLAPMQYVPIEPSLERMSPLLELRDVPVVNSVHDDLNVLVH